jgi:hypothetical protein
MDRLEQWVKQDRKWLRKQRISHAEYQKSIAKTDEDKQFWQQVIEVNQVNSSK